MRLWVPRPSWRPPATARSPCWRSRRCAAASRSAVARMTWSMRTGLGASVPPTGGQPTLRRPGARHPDGLVVSIPEPGLAPAIRRATAAGIPVVSINSGSEVFRRLGVLAHVGQPEGRSGRAAGERLARAGVRRALCVNQQVGNQGLDARCAGLDRAMRRAGGTSRVLGVDDQSAATPGRIAAAIRAGRIDGVLTTNATTALEAMQAVRRLGRVNSVKIGTFDLGPDVLDAVKAGRLLFAVDP